MKVKPENFFIGQGNELRRRFEKINEETRPARRSQSQADKPRACRRKRRIADGAAVRVSARSTATAPRFGGMFPEHRAEFQAKPTAGPSRKRSRVAKAKVFPSH